MNYVLCSDILPQTPSMFVCWLCKTLESPTAWNFISKYQSKYLLSVCAEENSLSIEGHTLAENWNDHYRKV